ncbi:MAG: helix-turn-helix domain-containing protein [Chloroflexi bacterium]|nr:helix-turn-helix domain-containing protein [Chloroflexota bacterium]MCI0575130.1 helix-turn-helix domain-containing protein [Chloroflexota bacterium]MCI0646279.1 helix-turn-helix domain-containing protein [Chloroflexota bacterium]MCI0728624.1 helix-turn-helix domain-containing protein [Chloroflexota bacterium]
MAEDLWNLRKHRKMTVKQLSAKSGVPAASIYEYERGQPVRAADIARLAKALFIKESELKVKSDPVPKESKQAPSPQERPAAEAPPKPRPPRRPPQPLQMARPSQVDHLRQIAAKLGQAENDLVARLGKPLEELTLAEARQWLGVYTQEVVAFNQMEEQERPAGTRRKRAYLPEAVDSFELDYLTNCQETGDTLTFTLLNGQVFTGRVVGFSPYTITIQPEDGQEVTIHKLALAYYQRERAV